MKIYLAWVLGLSSFLYAGKIQQAIHQTVTPAGQDRNSRSINTEISPIPTNDAEIEEFLGKEKSKIRKSIQQTSHSHSTAEPCVLTDQDPHPKLILEPEHHACKQCAERTHEVLHSIKPKKKAKPVPKPPIYAHEGFYLESTPEPDTGLYGIESPFQHSFSGLIVALQELRRYEKEPKKTLEAVSGIVDVLLFDKPLAELFLQKFPHDSEKSKLMQGLIHYAKMGDPNADESRQLFLFDHVLPGRQNKLLERNLTAFIEEKLLPKLASNGIQDTALLKDFLDHSEKRDLDWKLQLQFNFHWRNQTLVNNIMKLYCHASKEGRDLHITLGYLHIPEVWKMLHEKMASFKDQDQNLKIDPGFSQHEWKSHFGKILEEDLSKCSSEKAKKMLSEPELNEKNYALTAACFIQEKSKSRF